MEIKYIEIKKEKCAKCKKQIKMAKYSSKRYNGWLCQNCNYETDE